MLSDAKLASMPVDRLTAKALSDWRAGLPETLSPAGVNRLFNDLRAALNAHIAAHWRDLPPTLSREIAAGLKALPDAQSARRALLSDSDVRRVVEAAYGIDADFGALVLVLASTGARFSQAARITVADFQPEAARVMVPSSLKGTSSKARRSAAVPLGADVVERLERLIAGRSGHEMLLEHWVARRAGNAFVWEPVQRAPWRDAYAMLRNWKKTLRVAGVPYVEPYALRHSSIVRCLREGLPTRVTAALHDTSSTMIERHYASYILDAVDELSRKAIVPLVSAPPAPLTIVA